MAKSKQAKEKDYQRLVQSKKPPTPVFKNVAIAFLVGGTICLIGQVISQFYINVFHFTKENAGNPTAATLIFLASIATGLGVYDDLAKRAGAGSAVPVTGFANSIVSAALEFKREGYVLGVGTKMFVVAGPVIVFGVVAAFVVGIIHAILR